MSVGRWLTVAGLTGLALVALYVPPSRAPEWVSYAVAIAALVAVGLIVRDARALWAAVAFAACFCVVWYVEFFSTTADDGILDGLVLGLIALAVAAAAVAAGVLAGRRLH